MTDPGELRPFPRAEQQLAQRAADDLPTLDLAEVVSDGLGVVLQHVDLPDAEGDPPDEWWQTKAVVYLGLLAGRSLRAVIALLRLGYDSEALLFKRRLDEVHARVQRVVDPQPGGQRAREWLAGRDSTARRVVELPDGSWDMHSHVAHADFRAVEQHLVERVEGGRPIFTILPHRIIDKANATAVICAMLTRDVMVVIASFKSFRVNGLDVLDASLHAASERWIVPDDEQGKPPEGL